jgi:hypothetical protein
VYVAGPISVGDVEANVRRAVSVGLELFRAGYAPFIPHLSHFADPLALCGTEAYEGWLDLDRSFISVCDALLRLPGYSAGADREVAFAKSYWVPVYYSVDHLLLELAPTR